VDAGLRTPDGQALPGLYPGQSEYVSAVSALDDGRYMKLAHESVTAFRRQILETYRFSAADGSERVMLNIPLAILIVLWGGRCRGLS
jgi:hypothetical protein